VSGLGLVDNDDREAGAEAVQARPLVALHLRQLHNLRVLVAWCDHISSENRNRRDTTSRAMLMRNRCSTKV
jgi:hypothetical protein